MQVEKQTFIHDPMKTGVSVMPMYGIQVIVMTAEIEALSNPLQNRWILMKAIK